MANHEDGSGLKLYVHQGSQPARAVTIFCRANHIEAQEIKVDITQMETRTAEYKNKINPMGKIPCIDDNGFKLYESHAILRYLATTRNVADHWYPKDPKQRALVDAALDWHHLNLRRYACQLVVSRVLCKLPGHAGFFPDTDHDALSAESVKMLPRVFDELEVMLQHGKFLQNANELSIADLSLACEVAHLQLLGKEGQESLLGCHERINKWLADVEEAASPYFKDVHEEVIVPYAKHIEEIRAQGHLGAL
ncbi:hypothetical protein M758_8G180900 [Ceratodon purpureus]|uniref:Glutathione transferase n=1 Tax=Ceratodon purpureus TaxID=3225 RepID=A0A8T0GZW1_CERPU|nr:hypothetical protein KC19_8G185800 [Ceratodon purpureus]KAG0609392.1 hypothetical protein M758_8G180900 [Ceratodon purpureus]KAG0609394.1 hypothetical protein M758_8G180900 [Ceratodon purpureus]KAG0609395.1 hypothetical protein M758_8G180900 [Ceratodon purpureus]KAG0609396.1 hypothetical protein M758_8G180900 [Ceratodon purpureus]